VNYVVVCLVACGASMLTFFSGFGLGTLLLPVFAVFLPLPVAIAATALVHLANNLFKLGLVGKYADRRLVVRFGVPAALAASAGAWLLLRLAALPPLATYRLGDRTVAVLPLGLVLGVLIAGFALAELLPNLAARRFDARLLPLGGVLSGFFGGLSGHQGALRAAFLVKSGLDPQTFVGTGVACAVIVDVVRLGVYGASALRGHLAALGDGDGIGLVVAATLAAFVGAWSGRRLLHKMTVRLVQLVVGILLLLLAFGIGAGIL